MSNTNEHMRKKNASTPKSGETGVNAARRHVIRKTNSAKHQRREIAPEATTYKNRSINDAILDQRGQHWLKVEFLGKAVWAKPEDFLGAASGIQARFAKVGIVLQNSAARSLAKEAATRHTYRRAVVAYQPGWVEGHYVIADGTIISPDGEGVELPIQFDPSAKFRAQGSVDNWVDAITPLVRHQHFSMYAICIPFLPPLLEVMQAGGIDIQNPMFEVVGPSTRAKTTVAIKLAGSAVGFASRHAGFGENWYTTKEGLIPLMRLHSDCFLGMDETNLASENKVDRGKLVAAAVHIVANGTSKTTKPDGVGNEVFRVALMSTSNKSLLDAVEIEPGAGDHLSARLISIIPPRSKLGVLSHIPRMFSKSGEFVDAMREAAASYHGAPFRAFIERLVNERHSDPMRLVRSIKAGIKRFMKAAAISGDDPLTYRRAMPFAAAYAAGLLARRWGMLPKKSAVGSYLEAFKVVWGWSTTPRAVLVQKRMTPEAAISAYIAENKSRFAKASAAPRLSDRQFAKHPGLITKTAGQRELVLSRKRFDSIFDFDLQTKAALRQKRILAERKRNTVKRTVRKDKNGKLVKNERVVAIRMKRL